MNVRRKLVIGVGALLLVMSASALAQQPAKVARIGVLVGSSVADNSPYIRNVREGLRDLGYVEGRNFVFEFRYADGRFERLPALAAELVRLPVDVIVAFGDPVVLAAKQATSTIPIVMTSVGDPIGRGFVASLARPGGNITGVSNLALPLVAKWLESLKQIVPTLSQVALLRNDANPTHALFWAEAEKAAATLGLKLQGVAVHSADDLEGAFASIVREQSGAIVVLPDPLLAGVSRARVPDLAIQNRLPAMCTFREQAQAGCLVSYGPSSADNYRKTASYIDKILKGAKPADLPVDQPTKFDLLINLKTAKALGLAIPQTLLLRADEVIQ